MKNYRITVNGNVYDVQVEEVHGNVTPSPRVAAPAPTAAPAPVAQAAAPAPAAAPAAPVAGGENITAPMPGNILDIRVNVGDKIGENQVVIILEAMKMENEITSPFAGTVASVNVSKGQSVNSGDVLVTIAK
jgi:biotin carboxyl carrier protein